MIVVLCLIVYGLTYEVLYSFNCGSEHQVKTPLLTFNSVPSLLMIGPNVLRLKISRLKKIVTSS